METADDFNLGIINSFITLDSGFDLEFNKTIIRYANLIPVVKPNIRGLKDREKIYRILGEFKKKKIFIRNGIRLEDVLLGKTLIENLLFVMKDCNLLLWILDTLLIQGLKYFSNLTF